MWMRWNDTTHIFEQSTNDGASWSVLPLNASILTEGVINAARLPNLPANILPANIAYKDTTNLFIADQRISKVSPALRITDTGGGPDAKVFNILNTQGSLIFQALNDAETTQQSAITISHAGALNAGALSASGSVTAGTDHFEKGRAIAMGAWINQPFNAAHYSAVSPAVWTIGSAAVVTNRYCLIGKVLIWQLYIAWFAGGNVLSQPTTGLNITLPGGLLSAGGPTMVPIAYVVDGATQGGYASAAGGSAQFSKYAAANWTSASPGFITTIVLEVA